MGVLWRELHTLSLSPLVIRVEPYGAIPNKTFLYVSNIPVLKSENKDIFPQGFIYH